MGIDVCPLLKVNSSILVSQIRRAINKTEYCGKIVGDTSAKDAWWRSEYREALKEEKKFLQNKTEKNEKEKEVIIKDYYNYNEEDSDESEREMEENERFFEFSQMFICISSVTRFQINWFQFSFFIPIS